MKIGEFLKKHLDNKGYSIAELSRKSGVPASTISSILLRNNTTVDIEMMLKLCNALECDFEDYVDQFREEPVPQLPYTFRSKYYKLDSFGKEAVNCVLDIEYKRCTVPKSKIQLPYCSELVSAGTGEWLDESSEQSRCYPDCRESRRADMVITISGDSMEPDFSDGDEVYVELMDEIPVGKTGIFVYNGKGLIKQFCGDHLESLNKKYKPIWPEEDIPFRTVGLVLGKVDWGDDE